jgi:hypothetical protein
MVLPFETVTRQRNFKACSVLFKMKCAAPTYPMDDPGIRLTMTEERRNHTGDRKIFT